MAISVKIKDNNGNDISNQYVVTSDSSPYGDRLVIRALDELPFKDFINEDDIYLLRNLLEEKIKYGDYVPVVRKMLEVHDKLEKLLEENSING